MWEASHKAYIKYRLYYIAFFIKDQESWNKQLSGSTESVRNNLSEKDARHFFLILAINQRIILSPILFHWPNRPVALRPTKYTAYHMRHMIYEKLDRFEIIRASNGSNRNNSRNLGEIF